MTSSVHPQDMRVVARPADYRHAWAHASRRLTERYGLTMDLTEYIELCQSLAALEFGALPKASWRMSGGRILLNLRICGTPTRAWLDTASGLIVTWTMYSPAAALDVERTEQRWQDRQQERQRRKYCRHEKHRRPL